MPYPKFDSIYRTDNVLLLNELNYGRHEMMVELEKYFPYLTNEQMSIYCHVIDAASSGQVGFHFVHGYGGTGKTFVWKALCAKLRSEGKVVLTVAPSGIASFLLLGGRTAHSTFAILLQLNEDSICNIRPNSPKGNLLKHCSVIIWDEAPMVNKWAFEALDRTLRDLMGIVGNQNSTKPFGGKVVVLGGDFRQILPVIPKASCANIVISSINSSILWSHCEVLCLTKNMRLQQSTDNFDAGSTNVFARWILDIGEGKVGREVDGELEVDIPDDLLILDWVEPISAIMLSTYPGLLDNIGNYTFFGERAILAPTIEAVERVNDYVIRLMLGNEKEYLSSDSTCRSYSDIGIDHDWITIEFLNEIKCSGLLNHRLTLKEGAPVMLLRNIDQSAGLCNGTRLIVTNLGVNVIGCQFTAGNNVGQKVYISRMNLIPFDSGIPLKFQRRQFPLCLCFAMTINKSQGQTLSHVGLFLPQSVFLHGQLYVAISWVKSKKGLKILICNNEGHPGRSSRNVVYKEIFNNV